jgi:hypothetical protein
MKIHILIALTISAMFDECRATSLYLNTTSSLLLDVFDICTAVAYNLSAEIEARKRFEIDRYLLFRPFTLLIKSAYILSSNTAETLLCQTHLARLVRVLFCGTASRQLGWVIPASLAHQSSQPLTQDRVSSCSLRGGKGADSNLVSVTLCKKDK